MSGWGTARRDHSALLLGAAWAILSLDLGCQRCASAPQPPLGTLSEIHGDRVERDHASAVERWQKAAIGSAFRLGDGVRTGPRAAAVVAIADGSELQLRQSTTVRFLIDGSAADEQPFDVRTGDALLIAGRDRLRLRTHVGLAMLAPGSQVTLTRHGDALEYQVDIGEVRLRAADGDLIVRAGENIEIGIGMAVLRKWSAAPALAREGPAPEAEQPAAPDSEAEDRAPRPGPTSEDGETRAGPDYFHLAVNAGDSFTVHSAEMPVAVAFDFHERCAGDGEVELVGGNQRSRARGRANLLLTAGARSYQVRCIDGDGGVLRRVVARGTARVLHDAGTRKLPPKPPTSFIEADGRGYTVYYQNQLPDVQVSWPNAPQARSYKLVLDETSTMVSGAEHLFRSGSLDDGAHRVYFEAEGRRSRTTAFEIRFDNAAPKASLSAPADRAFSSGDLVAIEGVALPKWKVSVEGGTIAIDAEQRFSGQVATSAARPDIAVRLRHPRLGTHYYLRRAATSN